MEESCSIFQIFLRNDACVLLTEFTCLEYWNVSEVTALKNTCYVCIFSSVVTREWILNSSFIISSWQAQSCLSRNDDWNSPVHLLNDEHVHSPAFTPGERAWALPVHCLFKDAFERGSFSFTACLFASCSTCGERWGLVNEPEGPRRMHV